MNVSAFPLPGDVSNGYIEIEKNGIDALPWDGGVIIEILMEDIENFYSLFLDFNKNENSHWENLTADTEWFYAGNGNEISAD